MLGRLFLINVHFSCFYELNLNYIFSLRICRLKRGINYQNARMIEVLHMVLPSRTLFYSLSNEKMERFFGSLLDLGLVIHRDRRVVHVFFFLIVKTCMHGTICYHDP